MIWASVTPRDPRLNSDPTTIVDGLKLKNLHKLYEYTLLIGGVKTFCVKTMFWPLWPMLTPYDFLGP